MQVIKSFLDSKPQRETRFSNNRPSRSWWRSFRNRHPNISLRVPQPIGKERCILTARAVDGWFDRLDRYLHDQNARSILEEPDRIYNCDESGFALGGKAKRKIMAEVGNKVVHEFKNSSKDQVTVLATASASGWYLPPYVLLPGMKARKGDNPPRGLPHGSIVRRTKKGWIDSKSFLHYLEEIFIKNLNDAKIPRPVILFVDGHPSHDTLEACDLARRNGVILYRFPAHATHLLQPLDVAVFKSLKTSWYKAERKFRITNTGDFVTKAKFTEVFGEAWKELISKPSVAENGFKAAGLYPFTKEYNQAHLGPSATFVRPSASRAATPGPHLPSTSGAATPGPHLPSTSGAVTPGPHLPSTSGAATPGPHLPSTSGAATPRPHLPSTSGAATPPLNVPWTFGADTPRLSDPAALGALVPPHTLSPAPINSFLQLPQVLYNPKKRSTVKFDAISSDEYFHQASEKRRKLAEEEESKMRRKKEREERKMKKQREQEEKKRRQKMLNSKWHVSVNGFKMRFQIEE